MEYEVYYIRSSGLIPSATSILCRLEANVYNLLYNITTVGDTKLGTEEGECQNWGQREARNLQGIAGLAVGELKSE
jgi:hypothetical protein